MIRATVCMKAETSRSLRLLGGDAVHIASGRHEVIFQIAGLGGEDHSRSAAVCGIGFATNQGVALHSLQGVHGRLLDPDPLAQFALGQPVVLVQCQHLGELTGRDAQRRPAWPVGQALLMNI